MKPQQTDVRSLAYGQHLCIGYSAESERQEILSHFVSHGLAGNDRVFYFAHRQPIDDVIAGLHENGVDATSFCNLGQLSIHTANDSYLASGTFDPDACMDQWIETIERALAAGFDGLRVAADMSWALDGISGSEKLLEYERNLSRIVFAGRPLIGLCEFQSELFGKAAMDDLIAAHEDGIIHAPPVIETPNLRVLKSFQPPGLVVAGAITQESHVNFEAALRHVVHATSGDVILDISEVYEVDRAGFQAIVRAARELYVGRTLVVRISHVPPVDFSEVSHLKSMRIEKAAC